jgi:DNA-binding CsgD family transcriptional regulator
MTEQSRTDKLLAMVLIHLMSEESNKEKAIALEKAGLTPAEIADALDTTAATVSQQLYEARKNKASVKSKRKA